MGLNLNRTPVDLNRDARNKENENWELIESLSKVVQGMYDDFDRILIDKTKGLNTDIVNVIKNGDFINGTNHHLVFSGDLNIVNGNAITTGNGSVFSTFGGVLSQNIADEIPTGDSWYITAKIRTLEESTRSLQVGFRGTSGYSHSVINDPEKDKWYNLSHIYSGGGNLSGIFRSSLTGMWTAGQNVGKKIEVEYYMVVNLSEAFRRGNEPSKAYMDKFLSNFNYFDADLGAGKLSKYLYDRNLEIENEFGDVKSRVGDFEDELEEVKKQPSKLINIIKNGGFKDGVTGWTSGSGTTTSVADGKLQLTGAGGHPIPRAFQRISEHYDEGDKVYLSAYFTPKNNLVSSVGFAVYSDLSAEQNIAYLTSSDISINKRINVSGIVETRESQGDMRIQVRSVYGSSSDAEGNTVEIDTVKAFNLTKFFGKGNEPTQAAFEKMLETIPSSNVHGGTNLGETQKALTQFVLSRPSSSEFLEKPLAVVAFDDGNLSDYEKAFPFLQMRGIPMTSYVITSLVGNSNRISWEQGKEIIKAGGYLGCHSHTHINMNTASDEEIREEMELVNRSFIDNGLPTPRHHALPFGAGTDSERVQSIIGEYRKTIRNSRGYIENTNNTYDGINFLRLNGLSVDMNEHRQQRLARTKSLMKSSAENREIVILYAHKLVDEEPTNDNIPETIFNEWAELIDYAVYLDFEFVNIDEMYLRAKR